MSIFCIFSVAVKINKKKGLLLVHFKMMPVIIFLRFSTRTRRNLRKAFKCYYRYYHYYHYYLFNEANDIKYFNGQSYLKGSQRRGRLKTCLSSTQK